MCDCCVSQGRTFPLENIDRVWRIFMFAGMWACVYLLVISVVRKSVWKYTSLSQKIVSFVHAFLVTPWIIVLLYVHSNTNNVWASCECIATLFYVFTGYMVYDVVLIWSTSRDVSLLIHHAVILVTYSYCALRPFMQYEALVYLCWEWSSVFLHLREILILLRFKGTQWFLGVEVCFAVSFVATRIVFGIPFSVRLMNNIVFSNAEYKVPYVTGVVFVLSCSVMNILNVYWVALIFGKAYRRLCIQKSD